MRTTVTCRCSSPKITWDLPGGVAETDESPRRAAHRELREEVGLDLEPGALLAVDWVRRVGQVTEVVAFLFDAGRTNTSASDLALQPEEIAAARFVTLDEAGGLLDLEAHARVREALSARISRAARYLEDGHAADTAS
nr:NUDIX hydrolase [Auraticoccus monumenti]